MQAPLIGDNPLAGIQVVATGIGYGYFAEKYTDDDGCFELEAKALGPVALYAQSRLLRSQAIRVLAPAPGMMRDIGTLPVGARNNSCPGVMEECEGRCVDTLTDDQHCGGCGNVCGEDGVEPDYPTLEAYHCVPVDSGEGGGVRGECGCDDEQEDCGGACGNIRVDNQHCGACFYSCGASDIECVEGSCDGAIDVCEVGFVDCFGECVPESQGCGVQCEPGSDGCNQPLMCGDEVCGLLMSESFAVGFAGCCTIVGSCGIAYADGFAATCASTDFGGAAAPECPSEDLAVTGSPSEGCCRNDGQCGLWLEGHNDLGCILRMDVDRMLTPYSCDGGAADGDAGIGAGGAGAGPDAGVAPDPVPDAGAF